MDLPDCGKPSGDGRRPSPDLRLSSKERGAASFGDLSLGLVEVE
jgi:hypothetical protein